MRRGRHPTTIAKSGAATCTTALRTVPRFGRVPPPPPTPSSACPPPRVTVQLATQPSDDTPIRGYRTVSYRAGVSAVSGHARRRNAGPAQGRNPLPVAVHFRPTYPPCRTRVPRLAPPRAPRRCGAPCLPPSSGPRPKGHSLIFSVPPTHSQRRHSARGSGGLAVSARVQRGIRTHLHDDKKRKKLQGSTGGHALFSRPPRAAAPSSESRDADSSLVRMPRRRATD